MSFHQTKRTQEQRWELSWTLRKLEGREGADTEGWAQPQNFLSRAGKNGLCSAPFSVKVGLCHTVKSELCINELCNAAAQGRAGQTQNAAPKSEVGKIQKVVHQTQSVRAGETPGRCAALSGRVSDCWEYSQGGGNEEIL